MLRACPRLSSLLLSGKTPVLSTGQLVPLLPQLPFAGHLTQLTVRLDEEACSDDWKRLATALPALPRLREVWLPAWELEARCRKDLEHKLSR